MVQLSHVDYFDLQVHKMGMIGHGGKDGQGHTSGERALFVVSIRKTANGKLRTLSLHRFCHLLTVLGVFDDPTELGDFGAQRVASLPIPGSSGSGTRFE